MGPLGLWAFHTLKNNRLKFRVSNLHVRLKRKACFNKPPRHSQDLSRILRAPLHLPQGAFQMKYSRQPGGRPCLDAVSTFPKTRQLK